MKIANRSSMVVKVTQPLPPQNSLLPCVQVRCVRLDAMKRRWRAMAEDGAEFIFELEKPLQHGACVWMSGDAVYVIDVAPEPLLEVSLDLAPSAAAGLGWAIGNLHLEAMTETNRLLTPDEPPARQLFDRIGISYRAVVDRFRPGRFARGASRETHELGSSHRH